MDSATDVRSKLCQAIAILESVIDGVSPIISDYQSIKSSDDQYECMDYGWASVASKGSADIIDRINILINSIDD